MGTPAGPLSVEDIRLEDAESQPPGLDGEEALLAPPGDPRRFAEAVLGLAHDAPRATGLGHNARKKAAIFGLPKYIARHLEVYTETAGCKQWNPLNCIIVLKCVVKFV